MIGAPLGNQPWTVCDAEGTVVSVGQPLPPLDPSRMVLVTPRAESAATTYLLYDGWRAEVDLRDRAVVRALSLEGIAPLRVSRALLDTVPEAPAVTVPHIAGVGTAGPPALGGFTVGTVVRVARADVDDFYVVLANGVQQIGEVAADIIRFAYGGLGELPLITPATIAATGSVETLPIGSFPRGTRAVVGARDALTVCAQWRPGSVGGESNTVVLTGAATAMDTVDVTALAQADGEGPHVDAVAFPGGRSAFVRSARILDDDGSTGPRFVVTDSGVAFGIRDDDAASYLGLRGAPGAAPWSILAHLPSGPELSTEAASVVRDGVPPPS